MSAAIIEYTESRAEVQDLEDSSKSVTLRLKSLLYLAKLVFYFNSENLLSKKAFYARDVVC